MLQEALVCVYVYVCVYRYLRSYMHSFQPVQQKARMLILLASVQWEQTSEKITELQNKASIFYNHTQKKVI